MGTTTGPARPGSPDYGLLGVLALPLLVLLFHRGWIYTVPSYLDPWFSLGYFLHFRDYLSYAGSYYPTSRIACWAPGALLYSLLPPLLANYALRLGYYYLAALSFYGVVKRTLGPPVALAGTLLLGTYSHFLEEIGWNYVDGAGIAYTLVTLFALTAARDGRRRGAWLALAGACFAAQVNTNLFLVTTAPVLALYYALACRAPTRKGVAVDGLWAAAGFVGLAALVALTLWALTGNGDCLRSQGEFVWYHFVKNPSATKDMWGEADLPPLGEWPQLFPFLHLPAAVLLATVASLAARAALRRPADRHALAFQLMFVLQAATMLFLQLRTRVLVTSFYVSYLMPTMFLAVAALLAPALQRCRRSAVPGVALVVLGTLAAFFRAAHLPAWVERHWSALSAWSGLGLTLPVALACLISLGLLAASLPRGWKPWAAAAVTFLLAFAFAGLTCAHCAPDIPARGYRGEAFRAICRGVALVDRAGGTLKTARFWYDDAEPTPAGGRGTSEDIYCSLNSVYLWGFTRFAPRFPALPAESAARLEKGNVLVVLSRRDSAAGAALAALAGRGVPAALFAEERVSRGGVSYTVTIIKIL